MITRPRKTAPGGRSGATLVEVLMALLIMSVGIVSVITMFPLAVLRSIQATQLTNSRLMKQNVQQAFRAHYSSPHSNPLQAASYALDGFSYGLMNQSTFTRLSAPPAWGSPPLPLPAPIASRTYFRGEWKPNTEYQAGELVVPTIRPGSTMPTPNLWFVCQANGLSGEIEPAWTVNSLLSDGSTGWQATVQVWPATGTTQRQFQPIFLNGTYYDGLNYVIDPLGWQMFAGGFSLNGAQTSANDFGYFSQNGLGGEVAPRTYGTGAQIFVNHRLLRTNGGMTTLADAEGIGMHGDTWSVLLSSLVTSVGPIAPLAGNRSAVFPVDVDLADIAAAFPTDAGQLRIVFTSNTGAITATRVLQTVGANPAVDAATRTVRWLEPLPTGLVVDGPARIERLDKNYSWFATVNRSTQGNTKVTVAVVFKRSFTPDDEHVYATNFNTGITDQISVSWGAGEPKPLLREGNYVLDAYAARWYKVLAVSGDTSSATGSVTVTLDQTVPLNHRITAGRLIVMRGIVEVFEL